MDIRYSFSREPLRERCRLGRQSFANTVPHWRLLQKFRNLEKEALDDLFQDVFTVLLNGGLKELSRII